MALHLLMSVNLLQLLTIDNQWLVQLLYIYLSEYLDYFSSLSYSLNFYCYSYTKITLEIIRIVNTIIANRSAGSKHNRLPVTPENIENAVMVI